MKNIIVTGATGGIGQSIAKYLAHQNYNLLLFSRNEMSLLQIKNTTHKINPKIKIEIGTINYCDLSTLYASNLIKNNDTDGIVIITPRPAASNQLLPTSEEWSEVFKSCFIGPLEFIKNCIPHLRKPAKIVLISGIASIQHMPDHNIFGVLRSMWIAQAKSLSHELGPQQIYVNSVSPGGVLTERAISKMQEKANNNNRTFQEQYNKSIENVPLRKYAQPAEIASVVEFFLSDKSSHVTGTNLLCDGGFTRAY